MRPVQSKCLLVAAAFVAALSLVACCASAALSASEFRSENGDTQMNTNIAVLGSPGALGDLDPKAQGAGLTVVDPASLLANSQAAKLDDIEEDPRDPFITTRSGKRRPMLMEEADDWADEAPMAKMPRRGGLSRVKRCGDDDGDANRSRRARRARRARRTRRARARRARTERRAASKAAASTTTTVTRKVIRNGQVVSETTHDGGAPVVASAAAPATTTTVVQQPAVVAPVAQQPVVVHQPAAVPSISVQGSIKVN